MIERYLEPDADIRVLPFTSDKEDRGMKKKMEAMAEQDLTMIMEKGAYRILQDEKIRGSLTYWAKIADDLGPKIDYSEAARIAREIFDNIYKKGIVSEEKIKIFAKLFKKLEQ